MLSKKQTRTMIRFFCIIFFHFSVFALFAQDDNNSERILNFHSEIVIDTTGRVQVTEHIKVYSLGISIKRGIVRRIPIYRKDVNNDKKRIDIKVLSVVRDGHAEDYHEDIENGMHIIYMGNKDRFLNPGVYEYAIAYESYGHVGFFDEFDELYWNVTGNDWDFMIDKASVAIRLPDGAKAIDMACYTGAEGSTDNACTSLSEDSVVSFYSNGALLKGEGLTVAVSFTRDIVKRPPPPGKVALFLQKSKKAISIITALLVVGFFYYFTWRKVGKDPEKPVVIPTFNPPNGWSPAVMRYLFKRKYDDKTYTASILSLAVKGSVVVSKDKKTFSLKKTGETTDLTLEEKKIHKTLFSKHPELQLSNKHHSIIFRAYSNLGNYLASKWKLNLYFKKNLKYSFFAALLIIAISILYALVNSYGNELIFFLIYGIFLLTGFSLLSSFAKIKTLIPRIIFLMIGLSVFLSPVFHLLFSILPHDYISGLFFVLLYASYPVYIYLIKAPTQLGVQTQADLEGFKMYLETAEENRLNLLMPPALTPELFEEMLPYAIALDVENKWSDKFHDVLVKCNYSPEWYKGDSKGIIHASFASSMSSSLTSSLGKSMINPNSSSSSSGGGSWSSGSSGGGRSGGGGGGGGGGGW